MTLETIALWWCYGFGALAAIGIYAVLFLFVADQLTNAFRVKKAILDWAWNRAKGYQLVPPEVLTKKLDV